MRLSGVGGWSVACPSDDDLVLDLSVRSTRWQTPAGAGPGEPDRLAAGDLEARRSSGDGAPGSSQ
jgi:hypothetical protein